MAVEIKNLSLLTPSQSGCALRLLIIMRPLRHSAEYVHTPLPVLHEDGTDTDDSAVEMEHSLSNLSQITFNESASITIDDIHVTLLSILHLVQPVAMCMILST